MNSNASTVDVVFFPVRVHLSFPTALFPLLQFVALAPPVRSFVGARAEDPVVLAAARVACPTRGASVDAETSI